jgi:NADH:ubiquinone oxidoreductase subunit 6 (subunit J)
MEHFVFYTLAGITLLSALGVVLMRNVLHSALLLGLCLAGVAGLFGSLASDFLFAAQILIYVGGIALLVLFVVMLSGRASELHLRQSNELWPGVLVVCGVLLYSMSRYIRSYGGARVAAEARATTGELGRLLTGDLALPFELISLVLIVALIGAVLFSRPETE